MATLLSYCSLVIERKVWSWGKEVSHLKTSVKNWSAASGLFWSAMFSGARASVGAPLGPNARPIQGSKAVASRGRRGRFLAFRFVFWGLCGLRLRGQQFEKVDPDVSLHDHFHQLIRGGHQHVPKPVERYVRTDVLPAMQTKILL